MNKTAASALDVIELTASNFKDEVLDDPSPILIDFWARWCMPCQIMKPLFRETAMLLKDEVRAAKVNVDEEPQLAEAFAIQGIPALVLIRGRKVIGAWTGVMPVGALAENVRSRLAE